MLLILIRTEDKFVYFQYLIKNIRVYQDLILHIMKWKDDFVSQFNKSKITCHYPTWWKLNSATPSYKVCHQILNLFCRKLYVSLVWDYCRDEFAWNKIDICETYNAMYINADGMDPSSSTNSSKIFSEIENVTEKNASWFNNYYNRDE